MQDKITWAYFLSIMKVTGLVCLVAVLFNALFWGTLFFMLYIGSPK